MSRVATSKKWWNGKLRHATPMCSTSMLQSSLIKRSMLTSRLLLQKSTLNATSKTQGCCQGLSTNRNTEKLVIRFTQARRIYWTATLQWTSSPMTKTSSRFARTSTNCRARLTNFTNVSPSMESKGQSITATSIQVKIFSTSPTLSWQESTMRLWMVTHFLTALGTSIEIHTHSIMSKGLMQEFAQKTR